MAESEPTTNGTTSSGGTQKKILINAFDMSTVGHLSPGQWKNPTDKSATKRSLDYWINLAQLLERGGINALFLADTYGGYDTYEDSLDNCIRRAAQWPMTDPTIPISAMAAVTKNLAFAITASTSFEPPFLLAKRFSTLDHFTGGRFGWNIVTSWKKAAFKAIGLDNPIEHDERYAQADEYLRVLYRCVFSIRVTLETIQLDGANSQTGSGKAAGRTTRSRRTKRRMNMSTPTASGPSSTKVSSSTSNRATLSIHHPNAHLFSSKLGLHPQAANLPPPTPKLSSCPRTRLLC